MIFSFRAILCSGLLAMALIVPFAGARAAAPQNNGPFWLERCDSVKDKKTTPYCEVFQELLYQAKGQKQAQRLAEMAIGYPAEKKGSPRAVIIVPLGVLLETPFKLQIGAKGNVFAFHPRYCSYTGCVSYLDLGPEQIQEMKNADQVTLMLQMANGKNVNIVLSLKGFGPVIDKLKH